MRFLGLEVRRAPLTPVPSNRRDGWISLIREPFTGAWQRNQEIRPDSVLAHHAVYSCITRISQDVGKLRPKLVEKDDDGIWTETSSPAFSGVLNQPNRFQNYIQFQEWWITSKLIHGNSYGLLERDARGVVSAIYLLDPTRVTPMVSPDGAIFYRLKQDNLAGLEISEVDVPASEIVHDRMNCLFHPLVGVSPIFACGTAANLGLEIQNNSAAFFSNGSTPAGVLSSPLNITKEQAEEMQLQWNSRYGPNGPGGVAILGNNMKFEAMTMTAVDSQVIEQLKWTGETVCSTFHVPPFKIGIGNQPAYTDADKLNNVYYSDCLQSHIESFELSMDAALGLRTAVSGGKIYGVELDLDGLLRMDTASQITTLKEAVSGSIMRVNEARRKVDLKPVDGGDSIWMQQQNYSLEALQERDRNDPFAKAPPPALPSPEAQKALPASTEPSDESRAWADLFLRDAALSFGELELIELQTRYDPSQPRVPGGDHGGEWTATITAWQQALRQEASSQEEAKAIADKLQKENTEDQEWKDFRGGVKEWQRSFEGPDAMRARIDAVLAGQSDDPQATALLRALNEERADSPELFRGVGVADNDEALFARYKAGTEFDLPMSSFTRDKKIAHGFAEWGVDSGKPNWVIFKMKSGSRAVPVENLSWRWGEREWLSGGRFKVVSVEKKPPLSAWQFKGYTEVTLEQTGVFDVR